MITAPVVDGTPDIALLPVRHDVPHFETAIAVPSDRRLGAAAVELQATIRRTAGAEEPGVPVRP